jgi:hypothetical protein
VSESAIPPPQWKPPIWAVLNCGVASLKPQTRRVKFDNVEAVCVCVAGVPPSLMY